MLLKITNNMFKMVETGRVIILVTLDQSAAFDTIDHTLFARRLEHLFSVTCSALSWLCFYLNGCSGSLRVGFVGLYIGRPQVSSLSPLLFLFVIPLSDLIL